MKTLTDRAVDVFFFGFLIACALSIVGLFVGSWLMER